MHNCSKNTVEIATDVTDLTLVYSELVVVIQLADVTHPPLFFFFNLSFQTSMHSYLWYL